MTPPTGAPTGAVTAQRWRAAAQDPSRRTRLAAPLGVIGGLGLATLALHLRDPHQQGSWGLCPSALLGFSCPGCGGLRAVHDLTDLRLADAASSNLLLVVAMPVVVLLLLVWTVDRWRGVRRTAPPWLARLGLPAMVLVVGGFGVLRNLPGLSWLAP